MLTSTFFSTCHLSSTSWVSFTELSSGCGDKAYYHSFDSSLFIMPCDSWKMREDSARQDFKIIVTTPYCFWIVQKFLEMQCVEHWWGKSWHWREGSLEQTLGSCLGKAFSQLRVAYPLGTRLWQDLFVPAATISSVNPQQGAVWLQSALTICLHMSWWSVFNFLSISEWLICVFHSDSIIRHWILAITYILFALMWSCVGVCVRTPSAWRPLAKASIAS